MSPSFNKLVQYYTKLYISYFHTITNSWVLKAMKAAFYNNYKKVVFKVVPEKAFLFEMLINTKLMKFCDQKVKVIQYRK